MKTNKTVRDNQVWAQILNDDGTVAYELPEADFIRSVAGTELANGQKDPNAPKVEEVKASKIPSGVKKGILIGAGIAGAVGAYVLGGKRGKASGYSEGYTDGRSSAMNDRLDESTIGSEALE